MTHHLILVIDMTRNKIKTSYIQNLQFDLNAIKIEDDP